MKDNGKMIYKMEMELKLGQMDLNMKVVIKKEKNMDLVNIFGMMDLHMKVIGWITRFVEGESIVGLMVEYEIYYIIRNMMVNG